MVWDEVSRNVTRLARIRGQSVRRSPSSVLSTAQVGLASEARSSERNVGGVGRTVATPRTAEPSPEPTKTIITQVELPVPDPVAEEPNSTAPESSATPEAEGPKIIFGGPNQPRQRGGPNQPSQPGNAQANPSPAQQDPMALLKAGQYDEAEAIATSRQDANLARTIGWALYNTRRYTGAEKWFEQATQWDEGDYESAYGLTLSVIRLGDYDKAEEIARWRMEEYPAMRTAIGDILTARAVEAYKAKEYRRSHELFTEVKTYRNLTRDEQVLDAQLAAGITIKADKRANYNEYSIGVFLRYFFESRGGLFATDF
jgi:hypothetical protein